MNRTCQFDSVSMVLPVAGQQTCILGMKSTVNKLNLFVLVESYEKVMLSVSPSYR